MAEYERALDENGVTREQVAAFLDANPKFRARSTRPTHVYCGNNADIVAAVAPYITKTRAQRWKDAPHDVRERQQGGRPEDAAPRGQPRRGGRRRRRRSPSA